MAKPHYIIEYFWSDIMKIYYLNDSDCLPGKPQFNKNNSSKKKKNY